MPDTVRATCLDGIGLADYGGGGGVKKKFQVDLSRPRRRLPAMVKEADLFAVGRRGSGPGSRRMDESARWRPSRGRRG